MKSIRLLLTALALTAMATWSFPAPPAGTTVLNTGTVTDGTLSINTTPALTGIELDGAAPTVGFNVTAATADWDTEVTAFATSPRISFTYAGSTWFLGFSLHATGFRTGSIGAPAGYAWQQYVALSAQIYPETAPGSCVASGGGKCFALSLSFNASGGWVAGAGIGGETIVPGTTLSLADTGTVFASACTPPFTTLITGRTVTLSGGEITF